VSFRLVTDAQPSPCCSAPILLLSRRVDLIIPHLCASDAELFCAAADHVSLAAVLRQSRVWPGKRSKKQPKSVTKTKRRKSHYIFWLASLQRPSLGNCNAHVHRACGLASRRSGTRHGPHFGLLNSLPPVDRRHLRGLPLRLLCRPLFGCFGGRCGSVGLLGRRGSRRGDFGSLALCRGGLRVALVLGVLRCGINDVG